MRSEINADEPENIIHPLRSFPAEWEVDSVVLLAWPHEDTDWAPILEEARRCVADIIAAIVGLNRHVILLAPDAKAARKALATIAPKKLLTIVEYRTNDTWARDFGPLFVRRYDGSFEGVDFKFNGWGLKFAADRDNLATRHLFRSKILASQPVNMLSFVLEGGSVDSDGLGTIITTDECLLSPNRNGAMDRDEIEDIIMANLGAERMIWLRHGALAGDDTDSHIDTLARFAPGRRLIHCVCNDPSDPNYHDIQAMAAEINTLAPRYHLTPIPLPLPSPIYDPEDGHQLPATYANFLALPEAILMPTYGQPEADATARAILEEAFNRPIVTIDCQVLIRQHGSLHCMTMQIPRQALNL